MLALNLGPIVQTLLFLLFADLTALVAAVVGPTYDRLLVPELAPAAVYPPLTGPGSASGYLGAAAHFSAYLVAHVVDPATSLVALGVAILYFARAVSARWRAEFDTLLPRLLLAVVGSNFVVPIGGAILGVAGSLFPVVAGWDGGAWQHWVNLAGAGEIRYSWDNGLVAFVLSFVEFALVFALVLAIAVRDALLGVLLVLLPLWTLVWPFRPLATLGRRAWLLFVELAFLPCVLVVPLELAVRSPTAELLVGYLGVALASPFLLSLAGSNLVYLGFPSVGATLGPAVQRSLASGTDVPARLVPAGRSASSSTTSASTGVGALGQSVGQGVRAVGSASIPAAAPAFVAEVVGRGATHLVRHIGRAGPPSRRPPLRPGGAAGDGRG